VRCVPLSLILMFPGLSLAQSAPASGDPRWVVDQFFFASQWPTKTQYYTGEMKDRYSDAKTMGEFGAPARRSSLRQIGMTPSTTVFTVQVADRRRAQDWYAYLNKVATSWRLAAVRTLAIPAPFFMLLDSLQAARSLADSERQMLENMRLTVTPDSGLKAFFVIKRGDLESIANSFAREAARSIAAAPAGLKAPTPALRSLATRLATLHFRGAWRDADHLGCVFLEIGGMIDNEVGFVRCSSGANIPSMTPERFILVESITSGWYLYKTT
jgi:hypothetical protein